MRLMDGIKFAVTQIIRLGRTNNAAEVRVFALNDEFITFLQA